MSLDDGSFCWLHVFSRWERRKIVRLGTEKLRIRLIYSILERIVIIWRGTVWSDCVGRE